MEQHTGSSGSSSNKKRLSLAILVGLLVMTVKQIKNINYTEYNDFLRKITHKHEKHRVYQRETNKPLNKLAKIKNTTELFDKPTILFWKQPFPGFQVKNPYWYIPINSNLPWNKFCKAKIDCDFKVGWNPDWMKRADAVVYHPNFNDQNPPSDDFLEKSKLYRSYRQLFLFFLLESPKYHPKTKSPINYSKFDGFFNGTITYRTDSTFRQTYGSIGVLEHTELGEFKKRARVSFDKKHGAVAIITNCASDYRNDLVKKLDKLVKNSDGTLGLDLFGNCGQKLTDRKQDEARKRANTVR